MKLVTLLPGDKDPDAAIAATCAECGEPFGYGEKMTPSNVIAGRPHVHEECAGPSAALREWWLCSECLHVAPSDTWGIENGNNDTAVCPGCGFVHHDDEGSWVDAGTEIEMQRKRREALADAGS